MKLFKILWLIMFNVSFVTNSIGQNKLNCNIYLGDVDKDGTDDFIKVIDKRAIKVFKSDFQVSPLTNKTICFNDDIVKIIVGDFLGRENVVMVILESDGIHYYNYSTTRKQLLKLSQQQNFILYNQEDILVGDFDADKKDEVLLHNPRTGRVTFYEFNNVNRLTVVSQNKIRLGNLTDFDFKGKKIIVGEFNGNSDRDDLLIIDYKTQRIHRYSGAFHQGVNEFWYHFDAYNKDIKRSNNIAAVNINGDTTHDIVIRNADSGKYAFYYPNEFLPNGLKPITNVEAGQLPKDKGEAILVKHKDKRKKRNNILFMQGNFLKLTGAAFDSKIRKETFWWAYTSDKLCKTENLSPNHIIKRSEWKDTFNSILSSSNLRLNNFTPQQREYQTGEFEFYKPNDSFLDLNGSLFLLNIGEPIRTGPDAMYKMYINNWNSEKIEISGKPNSNLELKIEMEDNDSEIVGKCHNNLFCDLSPAPNFDYSNSKITIDINLFVQDGSFDYQAVSDFNANVLESGPCKDNIFALFCPSNRNSIIETNFEQQINSQINGAFKSRFLDILETLIALKGINLSNIKSLKISTDEDILLFE